MFFIVSKQLTKIIFVYAFLLVLQKNESTIYSNENVRRQDHLLDEESVRNLLAKCEYRVLLMVNDEGGVTHTVPLLSISA